MVKLHELTMVNSMTKNIVQENFLTDYEKSLIVTALRTLVDVCTRDSPTEVERILEKECAKILHILDDDWGGKFVVRKMTAAEIAEDEKNTVDIPASG
jgi:hypothetical protein